MHRNNGTGEHEAAYEVINQVLVIVLIMGPNSQYLVRLTCCSKRRYFGTHGYIRESLGTVNQDRSCVFSWASYICMAHGRPFAKSAFVVPIDQALGEYHRPSCYVAGPKLVRWMSYSMHDENIFCMDCYSCAPLSVPTNAYEDGTRSIYIGRSTLVFVRDCSE